MTFTTRERGVPSDQWERVLAEEQGLVDEARLELHRLVALAQRTSVAVTTSPDGKVSNAPKGVQPGRAGRRRGRLPKAEAEARRMSLLALVSQHSTLRYEFDKLAREVDVGPSTVRRWLKEEAKRERQRREEQRRKGAGEDDD
jgi:hypothetical protein